jgi:hypothetical protein
MDDGIGKAKIADPKPHLQTCGIFIGTRRFTMATARQIEANRRNAAGPHNMTEAGKQAARGNAIRHGLATRIHVVLPGEDQNSYNEILESLRAEYAPAGTQEELLVHQITENYSRLIRARNMESGSFIAVEQDFARNYDLESSPADDLTRGAQLTLAFSKRGKMFDKLNRYESTAERSYYRAIRELTKLQKARGADRQPAAKSPKPEPAPAPQPKPQIRSVPQNPPNYTQRDMELASMKMSDAEFDELLGEITAPPKH